MEVRGPDWVFMGFKAGSRKADGLFYGQNNHVGQKNNELDPAYIERNAVNS